MNFICDRDKCTGCAACVNICTKDALKMVKNERGFDHPIIDGQKCVDCKMCTKVCPVNNPYKVERNDQKVYAARSLNKELRGKSSSGALFTEISKVFLSDGGVIAGTVFNEDFTEAVFSLCRTEDELEKMRGSKYLQSAPGKIYRQVQAEIQNGKKVMFIGTPCQIAALKNLLKPTEQESVFCIDLICHGVPSPGLWKNYIDDVRKKQNNKRITGVNFRHKKPSWVQFSLKVDFEDNTSYIGSKFCDPYIVSFLREVSLRESCFDCQYTNTNRLGDITLADFWGYKSEKFSSRNDHLGISCCIVNSEKGRALFEKIKGNLLVENQTMEYAIRGNRSLVQPWVKNKYAEPFWELYTVGKINEAFNKYCIPYKPGKREKFTWWVYDHYYMFNPVMKVYHKVKK